MGGKAFGFEAKRMNEEEFKWVSQLLLQNIRMSHNKEVQAKVVISVRDKIDFGDVDVLVSNENFNFDDFWFNSKEYYKDYKRNGPVISILDFCDRQIDLILTQKEIFDVHYQYLAYNDMGNFVGRIAKSLNLKYGHDGLSLVVRHNDDPTKKIADIPIMTDVVKIYELLDVPYRKNGYDNMEQVYSDIMSSKYFHSDSFALEKQSHHARVRDRKRKSYHGMLNYIKEHDKSTNERRKYTIFETLNLVPAMVALKYVMVMGEYDNKRYEKTLFNGRIVGEVTGLEGKELGNFMVFAKNNVDIYGDVKAQISKLYSQYLYFLNN